MSTAFAVSRFFGGTPGANAVAQGQSKKSANCSRETTRRVHAFKTRYKRAVRSHDSAVWMVEAAFGADELVAAAPAAVDLERAF